MKIELLTDWGGAEKGATLTIGKETGTDLIKRGIAKKISARKGAGNGGKEKNK